MNILPDTDDIAMAAEWAKQTQALHAPELVARILAPQTVFATIAFCIELTGPIQEKYQKMGRVSSWQWEGIDYDKILIGYLSHDGQNLRFQTQDTTIFNISLRELKVKPHGLGVLIKNGEKQYIVGNYMSVNDILSPPTKMKYTFGGESTIWLRELAELGVIDKTAFKNDRTNKKLFLTVFYSIVILISIALIVFGDN